MKLNLEGNKPLYLMRDPLTPTEAVTKNYVDTSLSTHASDETLHLSAGQNTWIDAVTASSTEVNYLVGVTTEIQVQLDSKVSLNGDTMLGSLYMAADPVDMYETATKNYVDVQDALKVNLDGGTMTGYLSLNADPVSSMHAATMSYVDGVLSNHATDAALHLTDPQNTWIDAITATSTEVNQLEGVSSNVQAQLNSKLSLEGGTMTGLVTLSGNPSDPLQAATKQYVDDADAFKLNLTGGTMTGQIALAGDPVGPDDATSKNYVDSSLSVHTSDTALHLTEAQNTWIDGVTASDTEVNYLVGVTSGVQTQLDSKVALSGSTMTGALTLNANPTANLQAATKQYVDAADALKLNLDGGTMTGVLFLNAASDAPTSAATLGYVSTAVSTHAADESLHLTATQNTWIDAITATSTQVNYLAGVTSAVQTQLDTKFDKAGGTVSGDITLASGKAVFVSKIPASDTELVNKAYVDSKLAGKEWKDPVTAVNLITTLLTAPPASPVDRDAYIVAAGGTGLWTGKDGYVTIYNATSGSWTFLQPRAIAVGDRFGVGFVSATTIGSDLIAKTGNIVTLVSGTPGDYIWSTDTITASATTLVFDNTAPDFGVSYTYTNEGNWVATNTSVNISPGDALSLSGNTLNVNTGAGTQIVNDAIEAKINAASGIIFNVANEIELNYNPVDLQVTASGVTLSTATRASIDNAVTKSGASTVTGVITVAAGNKLTLVSAPAISTDAANKGYVDSQDTLLQTQITSISLLTTGLNTDPVSKTYVDEQDALKLNLTGGTLTGGLTLSADPTANLQAATKQYVDSGLSTHATDAALHLTSAQNTWLDAVTATSGQVNYLVGVTSAVQTQLDSKVAMAGGTMAGLLTLSADPTSIMHAVTKQYTDAGLTLKLNLTGGTMTGALTLSADPTSNLHSATKQYVDSGLSTHTADETVHLTAGQNTWIDAITATSTEVNYLVGVSSAIQAQINSKLPLAGGTLTGDLVLPGSPVSTLGAVPKQDLTAGLALKVDKAGDTLTGYLVLHAVPTADFHPATKKYTDDNLATHATDATLHISSAQNTWMDSITATATEINYLVGVTSAVQSQIDSKVNLTGGTLTGFLTLSAAPTANLHAATKKYVDDADALKLNLAGGTLTGALVLSGDPTAINEAANKGYVDAALVTAEGYTDTAAALKVAKAGDSMSGFLTLSGAPTADLHAATKKYADDGVAAYTTVVNGQLLTITTNVSTLRGDVDGLLVDPVTKNYVDVQDGTKLAKAGGTMTGYITLHTDPLLPMHPATKQYVDAIAQGLSVKTAVRLATTGNLVATYNNGTFGVNSTLTAAGNGVLTVDGVSPIVGDRILVAKQTDGTQNGDYVVQQVGDVNTPYILKRVSTVDESSEVPGSYFFVQDGDTLEGTGWTLTVVNPITFTIGTDAISVNQFSGQGSMIGGTGCTIAGNTINVNTANSARIVVNADDIDLATTGVTPSTYTKVTVDGYGRITTGANPTTIAGYNIADAQPLNANLTSISSVATTGLLVRTTGNEILTRKVAVSGVGLSINNDGTGSVATDLTITSNATNLGTASTLVARDPSGDFTANQITANLTGNATTATTLQTSRNFSISGDVTAAAVGFTGAGNVVLATTLGDTGVTAGTYNSVTVNSQGRVTAGTNPTTIAGYGITDAYTKTEVDAIVAGLNATIAELQAYIMSKM